MKFLNFTLLSFLSILGISVLLTSCGQEVIESTLHEIEEQLTDNQMPEGEYVTTLQVRDENNPESGALISVSTNNEEIYAQLIADNFEAKLVDLATLEAFQNVEDVGRTDEESNESLLNTDEHFFSMKTLETYTNEDEFVQFTFGDELLNVLRKYKAQTHIQVSQEEDNSRWSVWSNAFIAYGDGGSIPTKLNVRYDYNCNSNYFGSNTNSGFYNSYDFRSCKWPTNISTRKRYSYFTLTQDVLQSYTVYRTGACGSC